MRVLVFGAGVIGSVYGGKLLQSGHEVVMLARGGRLAELRDQGLILDDAELGHRTVLPVRTADSLAREDRYDLVLVPLRRDHLAAALPQLRAANDKATVLFFGNTAGLSHELSAALGARAAFGFPAAGGIQEGAVTRFVLIRQQRTMLGELDGTTSSRIQRLRALFNEAGFSAAITRNMEGWLTAHAAFIVPIAFALYRVDGDPRRLAADHTSLQLMVRATRQAFQALGTSGNAEIPSNLRILYQWMPERFAIHYWQSLMAGPRGELWFAAHSRVASDEMYSLAVQLQHTMSAVGHPTPALDTLLAGRVGPTSHHETDA
ncbi:MAG TPA: 2-dehydropantoate 2-reductase N-terminal domain-containing protein [Candidatus Dormibacteraeota bacterium]